MKRLIPFLLIVLFLAACAPATAVPVKVVEAPKQPESVQQPGYLKPAPTLAPQYLPTTAPAPQDNTFQNPGTNPEVNARRDHLSTFALDVDTASYTVTRSYLQGGNLPPADAIRVEEFVNFFKQDYPTPRGVAFGIYADGAPSPFSQGKETILRFGIQGYQVSEEDRKPLVLTFVLDISGSMSIENRLGLVKQSLELLVEQLYPDDSVAVVAYGSNARVVLDPTSGSDRRRILNAIDGLQPEGSTNMQSGLEMGYQIASETFRQDGSNRVVLCSDGVANVGDTTAEGILNSVGDYASRGISLNTYGVGMGNFNDALLEQLADHGHGSYAYIDTLDEARRLFVEKLTSSLQSIARNAKVQVDFNTDVVASYRQIGYEDRQISDQAFRDDSVTAGEIGAGHSVTALYAVELKPGAEGRIATIQLRWEDPQTGAVKEINGNYNTFDLSDSFDIASPRYQLDVVAAQWAEVMRQSPYAYNVSLNELSRYANQVARHIPQDADVVEFAGLVSLSAQIGD
jgi:Ca-activated chloride channel homolog